MKTYDSRCEMPSGARSRLLNPPLELVAQFVLVTIVFSLAYGQAPLFYSNQNQYLLHGLALGGHGLLADDWLANTTDPTPLFTYLVAATCRYLPLGALYVFYALILGIYAVSLLLLFDWLAGTPARKHGRLTFFALLVLVHCAFIRWLSYQWVGWDYPYYLQGGLAGQYVLGPVFQPSVFGVLLIASLVLFLKDRWRLAALVAGLGVLLHSTYVLSAGMLITGYLLVLLHERRLRAAVEVGFIALTLTVPVLLYVALYFPPTTPGDFAEAQRLLVHERIPHHCLPELWCDWIAVGQMFWIVAATALTWRTRLFPILASVVCLSTLLTLVQVVTASNGLALLFPWRASAVLMPVATAIVLGRLILLGQRCLDTRAAAGVSGLLLVLLAAAGVWIMATGQGYQTNDEELQMMHWVREHKQPGDVYLLPVQMPNLARTTYGSLSSDFKPLAQKKTDTRIIPVDLQRFRLVTGAPIYVDFKSVPYRDVDVLEWRRRMSWNQHVLDRLRTGQFEGLAAELRARGVTHVVLTPAVRVEHPDFAATYEDPYYRVLHVEPGSGRKQE